MEPNRHFANASERAESQSVDVSNLNLQQLRALLHEHEDSSRKSLDYALSKKQSAERHHDIAREREAEAQAYLTRYEAAEVVVEALRKTIVDRSKLVLERRYEPSPVRALEKRQRVSTQNTSVTVRADQHISHRVQIYTFLANELRLRRPTLQARSWSRLKPRLLSQPST
jgi:hypothetical protein